MTMRSNKADHTVHLTNSSNALLSICEWCHLVTEHENQSAVTGNVLFYKWLKQS